MLGHLHKIHHLIRYFILLGIVVFVGYFKELDNRIFLIFITPPIYLAHGLKTIISKTFPISSSNDVNMYFFLLPVTLLYFGLIGFQLKQLWNERGTIKIAILFIFLGFLFYIHYVAWKNVMTYFVSI